MDAMLEELPRLSMQEREELFSALLQCYQNDAPTGEEMRILDEAEKDYRADGKTGRSWAQVEADLRQR